MVNHKIFIVLGRRHFDRSSCLDWSLTAHICFLVLGQFAQNECVLTGVSRNVLVFTAEDKTQWIMCESKEKHWYSHVELLENKFYDMCLYVQLEAKCLLDGSKEALGGDTDWGKLGPAPSILSDRVVCGDETICPGYVPHEIPGQGWRQFASLVGSG